MVLNIYSSSEALLLLLSSALSSFYTISKLSSSGCIFTFKLLIGILHHTNTGLAVTERCFVAELASANEHTLLRFIKREFDWLELCAHMGRITERLLRGHTTRTIVVILSSK